MFRRFLKWLTSINMRARITSLWQRCQLACRGNFQDHWHNNQYRRELNRKPWYVIFGSQQSGKQQLLSNAGLRLLKPDVYGRQALSLVKQFSEFNWYFTQEAVFVDIQIDAIDKAQLLEKKFIKYLRRRRRAKPISGIIFTFSLPELILATHHKRREFLQSFADQVKSLYHTLKTPMPVYTVLTKNDLISGFCEFFSDMSKEELSQVWGITFPFAQSSNITAINHCFDHEYNQLMARLQQRVLWSLDAEKRQQDRNLIYAFPQQMQLFKKPIMTLFSELFAVLPKAQMVQLRGVYFTSAQQKGEPYNFFLHAIGRRYHLKSNYHMLQEEHRESYFIQKLFYDVILPESKVLGFSERAKKTKKWLYAMACIAAPLSVVASIGIYHHAYLLNNSNIVDVTAQLHAYHRALNDLQPTDTNMTATLPILNSLHKAEGIYAHHAWLPWVLFSSHSMRSYISDALERSLHTQFLPRIAANLEYILNRGNLDTNALYANLKGYLAFSPSHFTEPTAIRAPMEIKWAALYRTHDALRKQLRYYVQRASHSALDALPIDRPLINKVRLELQQIVPAERAYALLTIKSLAKGLSAIDLADTVGRNFNAVFTENIPGEQIPALYSSSGYQQIFEPELDSITTQVSDDNEELGIKSSKTVTTTPAHIAAQMRHNFNQNYLTYWHERLRNITVKPFYNFKQAAGVFDLLATDKSPLRKLLNIINDNTQAVSGDHINVKQHYSKLNEFSQGGITRSALSRAEKDFGQLRDYFLTLHAAVNVDQAAFKAVVSYLHGDTNNPIYKLSMLADEAPLPARRWLKSLVDNSWQLLLKHTLIDINNAWQTDVIAQYDAHIKGRYPLVYKVKGELDINNFTSFFGLNGTLHSFFKRYLSSFIDTNKKPWKLYVVNGHSLALLQRDINIFRRMQTIQNLYFQKTTGQPSISFSITPVILDDSASHAMLILGDQHIDYAHGPQKPTQLTWPTADLAQTKLIIRDFSGQSEVFADYGPWSIFKLIDDGHIHPTRDGNGYLFTVSLGHHYASFEIVSDATIDTFKLKGIKGFSLPQKL